MNSHKGLLMEFKQRVVEWICKHANEFQLVNACVEEFRGYIYDSNGNFLLGGDGVLDFIKQACRLMTE